MTFININHLQQSHTSSKLSMHSFNLPRNGVSFSNLVLSLCVDFIFECSSINLKFFLRESNIQLKVPTNFLTFVASHLYHHLHSIFYMLSLMTNFYFIVYQSPFFIYDYRLLLLLIALLFGYGDGEGGVRMIVISSRCIKISNLYFFDSLEDPILLFPEDSVLEAQVYVLSNYSICL